MGAAAKVAIEPRLLSKAEAAAYCGQSTTGFDRWRKSGMVPGYVPGTLRFDRLAIDAALDVLSKRAPQPAPAQEADPLDEWKKRRDARKRAN